MTTKQMIIQEWKEIKFILLIIIIFLAVVFYNLVFNPMFH